MSMTNLQFYLTKLSEEASEVAQIALKAQQFGPSEVVPGQPLNNFERCHVELDDLLAVVDVLNKEFKFGYIPDRARISGKKAKIAKYLALSQCLGLVENRDDTK